MDMQTSKQVMDDFLLDLKQTESEMLDCLEEANLRYSNTSKVIVAVVFIIAVGLVFSLFMIMQFARDIEQIESSMNSLNYHIVATKERTSDISFSLGGVADQTGLMPNLVASSSSISVNIAVMNEFFKGIEHNSISMSQSAQVIDNELKEMNNRFDNVNQNMDRIVYNVNQLSKTVP